MTEKLRTLNIGKMGVNEGFIAEARGMIARYRTIKIKVLKSALEGKNTGELAKEVSSKTNSVLVDVRGHTFTLVRR